jgi:hypothetical protein
MLDLGVKLAGSLRYNRDFIRNEGNAYLGLELTLWPPARGHRASTGQTGALAGPDLPALGGTGKLPAGQVVW